MDNTATYTAQAQSIYQPQEDAEQQTDQAAENAKQVGYATETTDTNDAYTQALADAQKATDTASAKDDFVAATHGLFNSGLAANAQRLTYQDFQDNVTKISTTRADKLASIASTEQADNASYQSQLGALKSKYQGEEADYVATHVNDDAKAQATQAAELQREEISAANKEPSATDKQEGVNSQLTSLFEGYDPKNTQQQGYTEKVVIPQLMSMGLSAQAAASQAYAYRKTAFGE